MRSVTRTMITAGCLAFMLVSASVSLASPSESGGPPETPPGQSATGFLEIVHADDFEAEGHDHSTHDHPSVPDHVLPGMEYWLTTDEGEGLLLEFDGYPPEAVPAIT